LDCQSPFKNLPKKYYNSVKYVKLVAPNTLRLMRNIY
jgi:hypothetical protein